MTTILWPLSLRPAVMVNWPKYFDHDRGQSIKIVEVKWLKLVNLDHPPFTKTRVLDLGS